MVTIYAVQTREGCAGTTLLSFTRDNWEDAVAAFHAYLPDADAQGIRIADCAVNPTDLVRSR